MSLIYLAIVTRTLGPADYGVFVIILTIALTVQLLVSFNVWQILVKYGHIHISREDYPALARVIRLCSVIDIFSALLNIVLVSLLLWFGHDAFGLPSELLPFSFAYAVIFLLSIRNVPRGILRLHNEFKPVFISDGVVPTLRLVGVLALPFVPLPLPWLLLVWAGSEMVGTAVFWHYSTKLMRERYGRPSPRNWHLALKENEGLPALLWASNIGESAYAAGQQLPTLIVGAFIGVTEAGLFRLAAQLSLSLTQVAGFINLASFTEMANVHARNGVGALKSLMVKVLVPTSILAVLIVVGALILGKPLILLMSGPAFLPAFPFFILLVSAAGLQIVTSSCDAALLAAGHAREMILVRLIGTGVLLGGLLIWLPRFGAMSAAWSKLAADGFVLVLMAGLCWKLLRRV